MDFKKKDIKHGWILQDDIPREIYYASRRINSRDYRYIVTENGERIESLPHNYTVWSSMEELVRIRLSIDKNRIKRLEEEIEDIKSKINKILGYE